MANQIVVSAGAKVRNLDGVLTGTSGVVNSLPINASNGIPQLDVNGKILVSQLPNSVMEYQGVWNANTNTPTLTNGGAFNQGDVYLCNVAGTTNFGAGPISFIVGDQAIYSGTIWQKAGGATGTVTSVAITESGDSLNITGSPITTSGTINIGFNGTNLQYVNGAGNLSTFPTLITSIGLSMPSAFSVANSPLTANGTLAVTGAGYASQYIRGDGTLADFPSSGGGGSSVSYYLNGGTSQGTIGGVTYYEMSKTADTGTGVDFTKSGDGFIVAFLTDANDPAQLNIPAGNWNYEIYASMSANGGTPQMYAELYKYDGTTFTLISTSSNEILYDGTNLNLYTFGMTVPATTLALTDRLAIKLYATNSGGKTTTIHTQDSHLCQIITTFSTGITALNGLTAQVQYFQVGTSGTDFNISSTTATHTFNIPDASATARGLITTGTQTIAGTKTFSDATKNNGGIFLQNASSGSLAGYMNIGGLTNGVKFTSGGGVSNTFTLPSATGYDYTFPNGTGTIALTSDLTGYVTLATAQTISGVKTFSTYQLLDAGILIKHGANITASGYTGIGAITTGLILGLAGGGSGSLIFNTTSNNQYTFPNATGTLALTTDLGAYLPLTGGTLTGVLNGTSASFSSTVTAVGYSKFWNGTTGLLIGAFSAGAGYGALYSTGVTPSTTNFALATNGASTVINATNDASIVTNNGNGLVVVGTGNVIINNGTTDAGYKLDVNGTFRAVGASIFSNTISAGGAGVNNVATFTTYDGGVATQLIGSTGNLKIFPLWNPSIGARINAENSAGSAYIPLSFYASAIYLNGAATFSSSVTAQLLAISNGYYLVGRNAANTAFRTLVTFDSSNKILIGQDSDITAITLGVGSEAMRITSGGNVLIGTTTDSAGVRLKVVGGIIGCLDVYNNTTGVAANVNIDANGFFARSTSSIKYKKNVEDYTKGLADIMKMRPVTYNSINETETQTYAGLIAEDIHELGLTEFVQYAEDGSPDALAYSNMIALAFKAIQELKAEIDTLKNK